MSEENIENVTLFKLQVAMESCQKLHDELDKIHDMETYLKEAGRVDRKIAEAMVSLEAFDPCLLPLESFTVTPSKTNYSVSMEHMSNAKKGVIAALIVAVLALIAKLVKFVVQRIFSGSGGGSSGSSSGGGKSRSNGKKGISKVGAPISSDKGLGRVMADETDAQKENIRDIKREKAEVSNSISENERKAKAIQVIEYYQRIFADNKIPSDLKAKIQNSMQLSELEQDPELSKLIKDACFYLALSTTKDGLNEYKALLNLHNYCVGRDFGVLHKTLAKLVLRYENFTGTDDPNETTQRSIAYSDLVNTIDHFVDKSMKDMFGHVRGHIPTLSDSYIKRVDQDEVMRLRAEFIMIAGTALKATEDMSPFRPLFNRIGDSAFTLVQSMTLSNAIEAKLDAVAKPSSKRDYEKIMKELESAIRTMESRARRKGPDAEEQIREVIQLINNWQNFFINVWVTTYHNLQQKSRLSEQAIIKLNLLLMERLRTILLEDVREHCGKEGLYEEETREVVEKVNGFYNTLTSIA